MSKSAAPVDHADRQRPIEDRADPIADAAEAIRADARRAPKTYARDAEVPGGGE